MGAPANGPDVARSKANEEQETKMNHQDVRNQYLQVHGIDPVEIEVDEMFKAREPGCECQWEEGDSPCVVHGLYEADEPRCNAASHGRRNSTCTCEDSRDE